jgi:hypothetical protein
MTNQFNADTLRLVPVVPSLRQITTMPFTVHPISFFSAQVYYRGVKALKLWNVTIKLGAENTSLAVSALHRNPIG